tara:strand:- start:1439 stop:1708 length:270 start_codon:yes stop_codon:yes gene_type:complete
MELAKQIRQEIKKTLGYSSRQVSVRNRPCGYSTSLKITVKSLDIPLEPIEAIAKKYKSVDRCEYTGKILSGGNTFIFVSYDWQLKHAEY